jgi:hypothetical protein
VCLGDLVDRGRSHLRLFDEILGWRDEGIEVTVVLGNHELLMLSALAFAEDEPGWTVEWMRNGGDGLLEEVATRDGLYLAGGGASPFPVELSGVGPAEAGYLTFRWRKFIRARGLEKIDFRGAHARLRGELFGSRGSEPGTVAKVFTGMKVGVKVKGWLACHAVPGVSWARVFEDGGVLGEEEVELSAAWVRARVGRYGKRLDTDLLTFVWNDKVTMDDDVARALRDQGIRGVIHGHVVERDGVPKRRDYRGIAVVALDVGMGEGVAGSPARWCYGEIGDDGSVYAESDRGVLVELRGEEAPSNRPKDQG